MNETLETEQREPAGKTAASAVADLVRRGRELRRLFDVPGYEEAIPLLREAIELDPSHAPAYAELAATYSYWGFRREICGLEYESLYDLSYDYADMALRLAPESAAAHCAMAVALRRGKKADLARRRREILIAADLDPEDPEILCESWRVGGYDPADAVLRRVLALAPRLVAVHIDLGAALCELGRLDEALAELQKALQINPRNIQAYYDIAMVLDRKGLRQKALAILLKAREFRHGDPLIEQGVDFLGHAP